MPITTSLSRLLTPNHLGYPSLLLWRGLLNRGDDLLFRHCLFYRTRRMLRRLRGKSAKQR